MTEYWVSQGNKWCDFCKIYISNNPLSIRTHELGQRHKDSVTQRLASMRKENAAKDKEQKEAVRALEQIEAKANRSYQKDLAAVRQVRDSNFNAVEATENNPGSAKVSGDEWEYDGATGYFISRDNGYYYDPNSGFYYSDVIGKWVTQEEALASLGSAGPKQPLKKAVSDDRGATKYQSGPSPGSGSVNPKRAVKGAPSSISVNKRKRVDEKPKPKVVSKEEAAALKAREAAKKRMEEREKPLLGLYKNF